MTANLKAILTKKNNAKHWNRNIHINGDSKFQEKS